MFNTMKQLLVGCLLLAGVCLIGAEEKIKVVLFPFREVVVSSRVESQTGKYNFRLGEPFSANAILTELEKENYSIKLKQAKDQLDFAKAAYLDKQELHKGKFTSDFELKKAEYEFRVSENAFTAAQLNVSYCTVKAPFAGKIVEFITREYETVRPGQQLFRIIDDNQLLAVMNIPLEDVKPVGTVKTLLIQDKIKVQGKVYEISPQADHRTGTVRIRILVDNKSGTLRAGMTGVLADDK